MTKGELHTANQLKEQIETLNKMYQEIGKINQENFIELVKPGGGTVAIRGELKSDVMHIILETYRQWIVKAETAFEEL